MQPIHMPRAPPQLLDWVLEMLIAYLLALAPDAGIDKSGVPVPSSYS